MTEKPTIIDPKLVFNGILEPIPTVEKIVQHHTSSTGGDIYYIHEYHLSLGWFGIGYNYFIDFDGNIYIGRGAHVGAHVIGYNRTTLGIGYQGNFDMLKMTDSQLNSGINLTAWLLLKYSLNPTNDNVVGHSDLGDTPCPGKNFRMKELMEGVKSKSL